MALERAPGNPAEMFAGSLGMKLGAGVEGGELGAADVVFVRAGVPPTMTEGNLAGWGLGTTFGVDGRAGVGRGTGLRLGILFGRLLLEPPPVWIVAGLEDGRASSSSPDSPLYV